MDVEIGGDTLMTEEDYEKEKSRIEGEIRRYTEMEFWEYNEWTRDDSLYVEVVEFFNERTQARVEELLDELDDLKNSYEVTPQNSYLYPDES